MFPAGLPGIALFVLRNCIAVSLAGCEFPAGWEHSVFLISLSMLCVGLLTPVVCGLAAFAVSVQFAHSGKVPTTNTILIVLSTLSLAVLGPGAFSVDARLFGRRILVSTSASDSKREDGA